MKARLPALFAHAEAVLGQLLRFEHPADGVVSRYFRDNRKLGPRERTFVAETCYTVLRRRRSLTHLCEGKPTPSRAFDRRPGQVPGLGPNASWRRPEVGRSEWALQLKAREEGAELSLGERTDLPDWLVDKPARRVRRGTAAALSAFRGLNLSAPLDLRVNPMKADARSGARPTGPERPRRRALGASRRRAIRLKDKPALAKHPLF